MTCQNSFIAMESHRTFIVASHEEVPSEETRLLASYARARVTRDHVMFLTLLAATSASGIAVLVLNAVTRQPRKDSISNGGASSPTSRGANNLLEAQQAAETRQAYKRRLCVGHAAVGESRSIAALTLPSKQDYANQHGYDLLTLEAEDRESLQYKYCPELRPELVAVEESIGLKYCTIWHALQHNTCDYMAWIDADATIVGRGIKLDRFLSEDIEAVWFQEHAHQQREVTFVNSSCDVNLQGLDTSVFLLGDVTNQGWLQAFVHMKLAFASMPKSFLMQSECECDASEDECTTRCLYQHHADWFDKAACPRGDLPDTQQRYQVTVDLNSLDPPITSRPLLLRPGVLKQSFIVKCKGGSLEARALCVQQTTGHL